MNICIRTEKEDEYRYVETLTRVSFWNVYKPGCDEHVMVHKLRESKEFVPELDLVAEVDGKIIGNIMGSRARITNEQNEILDEDSIIAVGPIGVLPEWQKKGIGSRLMEAIKSSAKSAGYKGLVLYGNPAYYHRFGFVDAKEYSITMPDGNNMDAFMVLELVPHGLDDIQGRCYESDAFEVSEEELEQFECSFIGKRLPMSERMEINPCGTYCGDCEDNGVVCDGCRNRNGRPIWYDLYDKKEPCVYYTCAMEQQYHDCSQCHKVPCSKFFEYPDPDMSDEFKQMWFKLRMENFSQINCVNPIDVKDTYQENVHRFCKDK